MRPNDHLIAATTSDQRAMILSRCNPQPNGCWDYLGRRTDRGYGRVRLQGIDVRVPRIALYHTTGTFGADTLHSCDNPCCINPAHLSWGDHTENMQERSERRRWNPARGEGSGSSKLTEEMVRLIRELAPTNSNRTLGAHFKVAHTTIGKIVRRKLWGHVA